MKTMLMLLKYLVRRFRRRVHVCPAHSPQILHPNDSWSRSPVARTSSSASMVVSHMYLTMCNSSFAGPGARALLMLSCAAMSGVAMHVEEGP